MATKVINLIKKLVVKTSNQPTVTEQQDTMTVKSGLKAGYSIYLYQ